MLSLSCFWVLNKKVTASLLSYLPRNQVQLSAQSTQEKDQSVCHFLRLVTLTRTRKTSSWLTISMDLTERERWHDSSSEDEKRPMDDALDALKHFRKGLASLESAMCHYTTEFEQTDPCDTKRHPFKQQFENTFEGTLFTCFYSRRLDVFPAIVR